MSYQFSCNWDRLVLVPTAHGSVVIADHWRLRLQDQTLMLAAQANTVDDWDPVVRYEVLLLCQQRALHLSAVDTASDLTRHIDLQPWGQLRPPINGEVQTTLSQTGSDSPTSLPICLRHTQPTIGSPTDIALLLQELQNVPLVQALFTVLDDPRCRPLIQPLSELSEPNRAALFSKYCFRRSSETVGVEEVSCSLTSSVVVNPSPTIRSGKAVSIEVLRQLILQVFRKNQRGSLATDPPITLFQATYPTPGGLASVDALLITTTGAESVRLWHYNSVCDELVELTQMHPLLTRLAWQALDEARLNYASQTLPSAVVLVMADLWTLQLKYGSGAFGLACLEAGIVVGALHQRLPEHRLGGCLCGGVQSWPLSALSGLKKPLAPLIAYALFGL